MSMSGLRALVAGGGGMGLTLSTQTGGVLSLDTAEGFTREGFTVIESLVMEYMKAITRRFVRLGGTIREGLPLDRFRLDRFTRLGNLEKGTVSCVADEKDEER
jgi:hypothetical protein